MIEIFAHRAIYESKENTILGLDNNLRSGFNVEIDVRKNNNGIYLSHESSDSGELFQSICEIIRKFSKKVAIHMKEDFEINELIKLISENNIGEKCFVFSTIRNYHELSSIDFATYKNNSEILPENKVLWCDESDEKWYRKEVFHELKKNNQFAIVMSKELLNETNFDKIKKDWKRLIDLKVGGICTDFPIELKKFLKEELE